MADYVTRYRRDAKPMPLAAFGREVQRGADPVQLARIFDVGVSAVLRRIATLPTQEGQEPVGLVVCDGSGTVTFRKPVDGFLVPRFGAACPLWPLYQAMLRPQVPIRAMVEQAGRDMPRFLVYAVAEMRSPAGFDAVQIVEATMLMVPESRADVGVEVAQPIGSSCRICPRGGCAARREVSILASEA